MVKLPIVAIVGRANVGKSTLFNRFTGQRIAIESETEGTTRDRLYRVASWSGHDFILADTAGLAFATGDDIGQSMQEQARLARDEADLILFVVDGLVPPTAEDERVARELRRIKKPLLLVANKIDANHQEIQASELNRLGLGEPFLVSALHGRGSGDLLDAVIDKIPKRTHSESVETSISLIGRPNVGKSSLLNTLIGKQRAIVSKVSGTTRDYVEEELTYQKGKYRLIDTAGIRRRGKVDRGIETFSVLRAVQAIEQSQIVLLILDATEPALAQDTHIAGLAKEAGKGIIVVVNKWDLIEKDTQTMDRYLKRLRKELDFIPWAPVVFVSAETGQNATKILELIAQVKIEIDRRITTPALNNFLQDLTIRKPPPGKGRYRPKLLYATQASVRPPTFVLFMSHPQAVHFSWPRFIENRLREEYGFQGTSLRINLKEKRR